MRTSIATVCLSGTLAEKMRAAADAGFDGIEIFEQDLVVSPHTPAQIRRRAAELGLSLDLYQPFRDLDGVEEDVFRDGLQRLEAKLERFPNQLERACVELAKDWRTDRYLRRLEAMMAVADEAHSYTLTGNGDVLEPEDGVIAIGSGGNYAFAAARALMDSDKSAEEVARRALDIAADICVYTNHNLVVETLDAE